MTKRVDLTGKRFGRMVALRYEGNRKWLCRCDCGNEKVVFGLDLRQGKTQSCGCLQRERTSEANRRHYGKGTRLHNIWCGMKERCFNPNFERFHRYGGRGITVCDEWKTSFITFRDWALSNGYRDDLTLDRINNDGNYEPRNCRWATAKEQFKNQNVSKEFLEHVNGGLKKFRK